MYIIVHRATFLNMGMTKAFGFFPTIDQEYNKKQVDSKYFFIEIIVFHQTLIEMDILLYNLN
jgi:hypothetical protein